MCCCSGAAGVGRIPQARPRQRVADRDQVARVPVARRRAPAAASHTDAVVAAALARRDHDHPDRERQHGRDHAELRADCESGGHRRQYERRGAAVAGEHQRARTRAGRTSPTTSLAALPACDEFIIGVASTTATPVVAAAPAPRDRPTHHAVNSTSMAQIRFRTGDKVSCLKQHDSRAHAASRRWPDRTASGTRCP